MPKTITVHIDFDEEASWFLSYERLSKALAELEKKGEITGWESDDDQWFDGDGRLLHPEDISTIRMRASKV